MGAQEISESIGPLPPHQLSEFTVEIEFLLPSLASDLDNLAKPVLDTLFAKPPNPNALEDTGILFEADDSRILHLAFPTPRRQPPRPTHH